MNKLNKNNIKLVFSFILGIVFTTFGVFAATLITANQVSYKDKTLDEAIDVLYDRSSNLTKFCRLIDGNFGEVSSKYECDPGDGTTRNFYLLAYNTNNSVELIMENNISDTLGEAKTMTWNNAMKFFTTGAGKDIPSAWKNVLAVDLPKAQSIANAANRSNWIAADSGLDWWCFGSKAQDTQSEPYCTNQDQGKYAWLFNHLINCKPSGCTDDSGAKAYGYWTRDLVSNNDDTWIVDRTGILANTTVSNYTHRGVRPVITVLKSNLYQ